MRGKIHYANKVWRIPYYLIQALKRIEWSQQEMQKYQDKHLRDVIANAFNNVQFYRRLFRAARVHPTDIKSVSDLNKLPIVSKTNMKKEPEAQLISKKVTLSNLDVLRTGGSTGEPFSIYISNEEDCWRKAIYLRANIKCGQKIRDRWVALIDADRVVDTTKIQHFIGFFARIVVPAHWGKHLQLKVLRELKPDILDGFPNTLLLLAREAEREGENSILPKKIFGSGELISKSSRDYLENIFGAPYYDQYGCTEIDRSAWQCSERSGYHMDMDSVIMQFVDENGEEVSPGEKGEIVYTSLFNHAMPFIRYNIEDVGVPINDDCSCGVKLPLMRVIEGRRNSFLVFPDGEVVAPMSFIETLGAFSFVREISQYRIIQRRKDWIEIFVKKTQDNVDDEMLRNRLIDNLLTKLPKVENVDLSNVRFDVKFVDDIPHKRKLNVVISNVHSDLESKI